MNGEELIRKIGASCAPIFRPSLPVGILTGHRQTGYRLPAENPSFPKHWVEQIEKALKGRD